MKRFLFNLIFLLCAMLSCSGMFVLKYQVLDKEQELASIQHKILQNQRTIHVLKAEWAHLNDPERLRTLIGEHTKLAVIKPTQIIALENVAYKETAAPVKKPVLMPAAYTQE